MHLGASPAESGHGAAGKPSGDLQATGRSFDELFQVCYPELRRIAQRLLSSERPNHTLQATALVSEAWIRLRALNDPRVNDADHCMALLARAMKRLLIDHALERKALRRGGGAGRLPLDNLDSLAVSEFGGWDEMERLNAAFSELERLDEQLARIVEAKIYLELTDADAAKLLGIGVTTYKKRWTFARAWLHAKLDGKAPPTG